MHIRVEPFTVHKHVPLTISRGTTSETTNLWLILEHDGIEGWGEASPFSVRGEPQTTEAIAQSFQTFTPHLAGYSPYERQALEALMQQHRLPSAARNALDLALHDWLGKKAGLPLWKLWGLDRDRIVPTSVTIGINTPAAAQQRLVDWLAVVDARAIKIKLGSPAGVNADQAMFTAVLEKVPPGAKVSVDANGGWTLEEAIAMSHWLCDRGVTYLEQPLPVGQEDNLPQLYRESPLPLFADESCFDRADIPKLADCVHGINIKLMKSGGLSEALRMVHTAQTFGLHLMFGCYSDSTLSNTAAAHLGPFATHLDLDSHLNLKDDPFVGATLHEGRLIPGNLPGLGVVRGGG
ncbi:MULTISPECIES: dipeptide epimerase [unclassified Leptolyngbya]|uniref:dipeptide epimerase n=1 Tax=unclassified Leptolyngbya TaxID=2650499 RepID=UPI001688BE2D|nr:MULTISPECIES: dipeptide epimerase [unclassified Leptolyngbya]MBD1910423.1 dipeptide epimerase [Leptolyngbya sp. FACHB-8]MBD2154191.1 dipeptide epimerase [Leptolyngbya sp. FACHB-16]